MTSQWGDGRDPDDPVRDRGSRADRPPREREGEPVDPVAVAAVVCGFLGIVVFGILLALVTGILAAVAGQRAREAGRSLNMAYLALSLAFVDGVVWLALHYLFDIGFQIG